MSTLWKAWFRQSGRPRLCTPILLEKRCNSFSLALAWGNVVAKKDQPGGMLLDWPVLENQPPTGKGRIRRAERMAREILDGLTLDQKIGQITQGEIQGVTPADVQQYCLGSVLNGGGSWPNGIGKTQTSWCR